MVTVRRGEGQWSNVSHQKLIWFPRSDPLSSCFDRKSVQGATVVNKRLAGVESGLRHGDGRQDVKANEKNSDAGIVVQLRLRFKRHGEFSFYGECRFP